MVHRQVLAVIFILALFVCPPYSSAEQSHPAINAPIAMIGSKLENWTDYFGADYEIVELAFLKNRHNNDPMIYFWITDGMTTVRFAINLITSEQRIADIESVEPNFLEHLGIDKLALDEAGNAELKHCWDAGCNRLKVHREQSGRVGAVWSYYAD